MIQIRGLSKRYTGKASNALAVDNIDLEIEQGQLVALLGPSGCGKTTTLRLIAGLERATTGEIRIGDRVVCDVARRTFVSPHRRPIGVVFQSYAIWPHMTVLQNVAFPLKVTRPRPNKAEIRERSLHALDLVGLAELADRPSTALSGGQQQRVALARALVREPEVLLLDEPLSNLDAGLRGRMRDEIRAIQQRLGITSVFVTHDQDEALAIADKVVVMNGGHIVETGLPQEIYTWPRSEFTATFLGVSNKMDGQVAAVGDDHLDVTLENGSLLRCRRCHGVAVGDEVRVFMRPESFELTRTRHAEGAWDGTVEFSIYHGDCWDYHVNVDGYTLRIRSYKEKVGLSRGDSVFVAAEGESAIVIPVVGSAEVLAESEPATPSHA